MKKVILPVVALLLVILLFPAWGDAQDLSTGRFFGIGAQVTAPFGTLINPNMFPATGLSTRLWLGDLFGIDVNFWIFPGSPSFAFRTLFKIYNSTIVDIYTGLGMGFFYNVTPFQLVSGLEVSISHNIALNFEVGLFGLGNTSGGVTSGFGAHIYF